MHGSVPPSLPRPGITHVIFDFDGTLSWLRHGWPELMAGLFLKHVPLSDLTLTARSQVHDQLLSDILSLNGKSSIFQMEKCASRVRQHGGPELLPEEMLSQYSDALEKTIRHRKTAISEGRAHRDDFVVYGARALLEQLQHRELVLIILSGTVEHQVKEEADLLGLAKFFGRHIYGGTADLAQSSKQAVLERLSREENVPGQQLLSFGDGPVEIALTKQAGGVAVGVASDEDQNGSGKMDPFKVQQLSEAGADLLIADYREPERLLERLLANQTVS